MVRSAPTDGLEELQPTLEDPPTLEILPRSNDCGGSADARCWEKAVLLEVLSSFGVLLREFKRTGL